MQSFNKPVTGARRKALAERTSNVTMASEQKISVGSYMYPYQLQQTPAPVTTKAEASAVKQTIDASNKQLSAAIPRGGPIILFIDAAAETMNSEAWEQLCQHFAKHGNFMASGMNDINHGPSFPLRYAEDDHLSAQWTMHLKEHLRVQMETNFRSNRATIVVVALQRHSFRKKIYQTIKANCDVELGLQS
ncbi:hypothetical protein LTS14_004396 [Recurvomyces mirabilis]|uniref:uncharacterized protein n=1 Tax=Recurvomyces mirabilis TaxID=574656 RepID=UPI002DE0DDFD|nr:hypothetical protein LTS14_004396 [Recurvomyces mirabilis]